MARVTEYTRRDRRDALIVKLRGKGWSLRRIGRHPDVNLSGSAVHAILNPAAEPDVADLRLLQSLEDDRGDALNILHRHRLRYLFPPGDPRAKVAERLYRRDGPLTWDEAAVALNVSPGWLRDEM